MIYHAFFLGNNRQYLRNVGVVISAARAMSSWVIDMPS